MAENTFTPTDEDFASAVFEEGGGIVIDLTNIAELTFEALPAGQYQGVIDEVSFGKSKSSGQWMLTIIWKVEGGDYDGRKLYQYASFGQKAIRGTKATLMRIDPNMFAGKFNPQEIADNGSMLGKRNMLRVTVGEGQNGQANNNVNVIPNVAGAEAGGNAGGGSFFPQA
jgi:hypothetical protein